MDKSVFKIVRSSNDLEDESCYWLTKTPQERMEAIEFLRQQYIAFQKLPTRIDKTLFSIDHGK